MRYLYENKIPKNIRIIERHIPNNQYMTMIGFIKLSDNGHYLEIVKDINDDKVFIISNESLQTIIDKEIQSLLNRKRYKRFSAFLSVLSWCFTFGRLFYKRYQIKEELKKIDEMRKANKIRKERLKALNVRNIEDVDNCIICYSAPGKLFLFFHCLCI